MRKEWIYLGKVKKHLVEIEHDETTGKLTLYLNGAILNSEEVNEGENKSFQFFIDDELCESGILYNGDKFSYYFHSLRKSTSTSSKNRQTSKKYHAKRAGFIVGGIFLAVVLTPLIIIGLTRYNKVQDLKKNGVKSVATVVVPNSETANFMDNTYFTYSIDGVDYQNGMDLKVTDRGEIVTPNGMPLKLNDEFSVLYSTKNPENSKLLFDEPTESTILKYKAIASEVIIRETNPARGPATILGYSECIVEFVYEEAGINGLANIYFKNERSIVNRKNNKSSFQDMMNQNTFKIQLNECQSQWLK